MANPCKQCYLSPPFYDMAICSSASRHKQEEEEGSAISSTSSGSPCVYRCTQVYFDMFSSIYQSRGYQACILLFNIFKILNNSQGKCSQNNFFVGLEILTCNKEQLLNFTQNLVKMHQKHSD